MTSTQETTAKRPEGELESTHQPETEATGWERSVESTHQPGDDSEATG